MKTSRLAITCLVVSARVLLSQVPPSIVGGGNAGIPPSEVMERTLTGTRWDVDTERGLRAWGDIRFREGHEFTTMNGPNGAWKVTGNGRVELGSMYLVEFAPGLETFVVTQNGGGKVATGKKFGAKGSAPTPVSPLPVATVIRPPLPAVPDRAKADGPFTTISIAEIANQPLDHLGRKPSGRVTYAGVPFEFADPQRVFQTQNHFNRNNPTIGSLTVNVPRPANLRVLVTGAAAGKPEYQGKEIGVIKLGFADGSEFVASLKAGTILRPETWAYNDANLRSPSGDDVIKVFNVVSEGQNRGRPATAYLDMLVIDLPPRKALTTLTGITISDTSLETVHSMEPGFGIAAITVGQAAAPATPVVAMPAAPPDSGVRTVPDPLGLNRPAIVTDKPLGITLPPLPGAVPPSPKVAAAPIVIPASMSGRFGAGRVQAMMQNKMKPSTEVAVLKGLRWLLQSQNDDGSWGDSNKSAMSGYALLCFLGHGETAESVEFGATVKKGVDWLVRTGTAADGRFATFNQSGVYEHGIATYALGEYYVMTRDERVKELFKAAVGFIVLGQGNGGGWMYGYDKTADDLSVSGWQIQALKAAHLSRLDIYGVDQALDKATSYLERVKGPKGGYGYRGPADSYSLTGVGMLCELFWKGERGILRKGMEWVLAETENTSPVKYEGEKADLYAWYYHTQACFMFGGGAWTKWNRWFQDEIAIAQNTDGSWPIPGGKAHGPQSTNTKSGAVYRTSLCILMLESFYRNVLKTGFVPINGAQPPATPLRLTLPPAVQRIAPGAR